MTAQAEVTITQPETGAMPPPAPKNDRPAWLPDKFKNPEDLAKAYGELERKQGAPPAKAAEAPPAEGAEDKAAEKPAESLSIEKAAETLEAKGLSMDDYTAEYQKSGKLSDDSYKKLAEKGIGKDVVDNYIAGQQAQAALYRVELLKDVGGDEGYAGMAAWASKNLQPPDLEAYNAAVESNDTKIQRQAIKGLYAQYINAVGHEPGLVHGARSTAVDVFQSNAELLEAIRDPQYAKSEAYREKVMAKYSRSRLN